MSSGRRLRLVVARYGPAIVGGAERLARSIGGTLAERGWEVEALTTCALDERTWANVLPPGRTVEGGVAVERFPVLVRRFHLPFRELSRGFWRMPTRLRPEALWLALQGPWSPRLHAALRRRPAAATLFVGYLYRTTVAGVLETAGIRLVLPTAHDEPALRLAAVGRALGAADGLLYATLEERSLCESVHPALRSLPAEVGNVGIEPPSAVHPERLRRQLGIAGPYLLYGGRSTPGKGLDELLDGFARLRADRPDVALVLTGEAGERVPASAGVVPAGRLDETARWDALAGAAAVVVPSFHESLSLLALEAWSVGRCALLNEASPVLAGQARRSGGALTYRGPEGLAAAARRLLDEPAHAAALGEAGRRHVAAAYTWDAVVGRLEKLLDDAAEHRRR